MAEVSRGGMGVPRPGRRRLSTPRLVGLIVVFWLVPQIVAIFVVPGVAEGPAYATVRAALQLEIVPDLGGAIIAVWAIVRLGWVDVVRHERFRTRPWVVIVPVTMIVGSIAAIDDANLFDAGAGLVVALAVGTLLTGVSEELMFRGITLQAMRDRHREWVAAVFSSLLFGGLHLANIIVAGPGAVVQAVWACGMGYLLYLCRRVGGGMVLPIVVHWIWDFSTFSSEVGNTDDVLLSDAAFAVFLLSIALVAVVAVRHRSIPASPTVTT